MFPEIDDRETLEMAKNEMILELEIELELESKRMRPQKYIKLNHLRPREREGRSRNGVLCCEEWELSSRKFRIREKREKKGRRE